MLTCLRLLGLFRLRSCRQVLPSTRMLVLSKQHRLLTLESVFLDSEFLFWLVPRSSDGSALRVGAESSLFSFAPCRAMRELERPFSPHPLLRPCRPWLRERLAPKPLQSRDSSNQMFR